MKTISELKVKINLVPEPTFKKGELVMERSGRRLYILCTGDVRSTVFAGVIVRNPDDDPRSYS